MEATEDHIASVLAQARRDGFLLRRVPAKQGDFAPGCYFGGSPTMPANMDWPYTDCYDTPPTPLTFIAQINLASLPVLEGHPEAPKSGTLFFFIEPKYGPRHEYASSTTAVLWTDADTLNLPERKMPKFDLTSLPLGELDQEYDHLSSLCALDKCGILFEPRMSIDRHALFELQGVGPAALTRAAELNIEEDDRLRQLQGGDGVLHSMFAGPASFGRLVDGEVIYETQLVPLCAFARDFFYGLSRDSDWVVFWISPEALAKGEFDSIFPYEGID